MVNANMKILITLNGEESIGDNIIGKMSKVVKLFPNTSISWKIEKEAKRHTCCFYHIDELIANKFDQMFKKRFVDK